MVPSQQGFFNPALHILICSFIVLLREPPNGAAKVSDHLLQGVTDGLRWALPPGTSTNSLRLSRVDLHTGTPFKGVHFAIVQLDIRQAACKHSCVISKC